MPDPPASLIKLLQKDKKVLKYFTSLQSNLNLDVKRWKDRALEYKRNHQELLHQMESKQHHHQFHHDDDETDETDDIVKRKEEKQQQQQQQQGNGVRGKRRSATSTKRTKKDVPVESIQVPIKFNNGRDEMSQEPKCDIKNTDIDANNGD